MAVGEIRSSSAVPRVEATLAGDGRKPYFAAAMFHFENDIDIAGILHRQALILELKREYTALDTAALAQLRKSPP